MAPLSEGKKKKLPALHIIRRQAARILKTVLAGSQQQRAVASVKSLVYKPAIVSKKATFALICHTLKYLPVIKEVLESAKVLEKNHKTQIELFYVLTHDLLFEKEILPSGDAEVLLLSRKSAVRAALVRLLVKNNVTEIDGLLPSTQQQCDASDVPRYVRVNTLRIPIEEAFEKLKESGARHDDLLPDVLTLPPGTDLHDHPLVLDGSIFLQSKASCMPAHALQPVEDWEVLDACAAPGNKTVHLAALMKGKGRVIACELNQKRLKVLQNTIKRAVAKNVEVIHQDFLKIDHNSPKFRNVRAILLDPSCSGSGTTAQRLDHLLPVSADGPELEKKRVERLASFQKAALCHALSFPGVERVVYSTCSLNQSENEDVVQSVLNHAHSLHFDLATVFPSWPHRGLPVFDGAHHLLRTDPVRDKTDGFFVAMFEKRQDSSRKRKPAAEPASPDLNTKKKKKKKHRKTS